MTRNDMSDRSRTGAITIAPLGDVPACLGCHKFSHVVSILGPRDEMPFPVVPRSTQHLRMSFDDVSYTTDFGRAPDDQDISSLISFFRSWNGNGHLLIHCKAGTSRSPAAGMIAISCIEKGKPDDKISELLSLKAYYRPNSTMLKLADRLLKLDKKLIVAAGLITTSNRKAESVSAATINIF